MPLGLDLLDTQFTSGEFNRKAAVHGWRKTMAINLDSETEKHLINSIKQFFAKELEDEIGDLKARLVLDFCIREIGPSVYNRAITDAQESIGNAVSDLDAIRYDPEFDFWKKR
jgi:uncharacterized protein (DUF2164 family)